MTTRVTRALRHRIARRPLVPPVPKPVPIRDSVAADLDASGRW
ncbi:hypothetical protein [Kibdelosporangium aridum]|nr:hypothetical protein [Kibdelosporangium aridum]